MSNPLEPPIPIRPDLAREWMLDPRITFLNHGSFGAVPRVVFDVHTSWRKRIEAEPVEMLFRGAAPLHAAARKSIGSTFGMAVQDFGMVTNATEGVNAVLRSLKLKPGDELLTTNHVYNAVRQAMKYVAARSGATVREIEIPTPLESSQQIEHRIVSSLSASTRLLVVDHITSPTALVFPVEPIIRAAAARSVDVMIDGAHAPGMVPLNVASLGAAYYAGNLHKWACSPKGSAFLWVRPDRQADIHPLIISHFLGDGFLAEFGWQGTRDIAAWLTVPAALEFLAALGWDKVRAYNHGLAVWTQRMLCERWGVDSLSPSTGELLGSMCTVRLPAPLDKLNVEDGAKFQAKLYYEEKIEVPVVIWAGAAHVRPCCQVYNAAEQYERLGDTILRFRDSVW